MDYAKIPVMKPARKYKSPVEKDKHVNSAIMEFLSENSMELRGDLRPEQIWDDQKVSVYKVKIKSKTEEVGLWDTIKSKIGL